MPDTTGGSGAQALQTWTDHQTRLQTLAARQLFFIGGAPRSGTTWIQLLLDSHPDISCTGEGLFMKHLAEPLDKAMEERRAALGAKNQAVFRQSGGFAPPTDDEAEHLLGTAILLALERQIGDRICRAVGEKTPENVFLFPRLKRLFPAAKFIGIARDPRDVLTSAWHFFQKLKPGEDEREAKLAFIRMALPSLGAGARDMLALTERHPADCLLITYEQMLRAPVAMAGRMFRCLGVTDDDDVVAQCVARTSFATLSRGRPAGEAANGAFFRKGVAGDWRSTLTDEMNAVIVQELGWMFPHFGWEL
ncbi:MAG TPA: sulfotransferase [Acetobacteraceae bacterium]|nr:sulfotransferase [Acetobacteraceae bacterium]